MSGLFKKYIVQKADTGEQVSDCFVLCPNTDPAAVIAINAYAEATDNGELRNDLLRWVGSCRNYPLTVEELREMVETGLETGGNRIWIWDMECKFSMPGLADELANEGGICGVYGAGEVEYINT